MSTVPQVHVYTYPRMQEICCNTKCQCTPPLQADNAPGVCV